MAFALIFSLLWVFVGVYAYLVLVLAGISVGVIFLIGPKTAAGNSRGYRKLLKLVGGDENTAERLISSEMKKYPDFSRSECIRRVTDQLLYDRMR